MKTRPDGLSVQLYRASQLLPDRYGLDVWPALLQQKQWVLRTRQLLIHALAAPSFRLVPSIACFNLTLFLHQANPGDLIGYAANRRGTQLSGEGARFFCRHFL